MWEFRVPFTIYGVGQKKWSRWISLKFIFWGLSLVFGCIDSKRNILRREICWILKNIYLLVWKCMRNGKSEHKIFLGFLPVIWLFNIIIYVYLKCLKWLHDSTSFFIFFFWLTRKGNLWNVLRNETRGRKIFSNQYFYIYTKFWF